MTPAEYLRGLLGADGRTNVATAETDLDGDGLNEFIVYVSGQDHCGTGGCRVLVLNAHDGAWRTVMDASVSRLPIRLLDTSSHGWRDLGVSFGGGGLAPGLARMRFDGNSYPDNPTGPSAADADMSEGSVLIAEDAPSGPLL
jgi:putative lipoprotein